MVATRQGKVLEQIKLSDGYKIVAREMSAPGASWTAIKIFKGRCIVFPYEAPESIRQQADILYKKYHAKRN